MYDIRAIIVAAGASTRLRPLTNEVPKCMLEINEKALIKHCMDHLNYNGIKHISVVTGYKAEKINFDSLHRYHNNDYLNNNILHSLLCAREVLELAIKEKNSIVISYSDIWYDQSIIKSLIQSQGDINLVVDTEWQSAYDGRTDHPVSEAELAFFTEGGVLKTIGKNAKKPMVGKSLSGEFIGLLLMKPPGIEQFLHHFDKVNSSLTLKSPFQKAAEWQKSYITDIIQDMVEFQAVVNCVAIEGKWKEFDTVQDFERGLPE
jgi:L-glutamine-phosphate cytidylyltransferase